MSDGGDERRAGGLVSDEENGGVSSTQLEQLESRVMERLMTRLSPGSREETLPTTETEGEPGGRIRGSCVRGSIGDRYP